MGNGERNRWHPPILLSEENFSWPPVFCHAPCAPAPLESSPGLNSRKGRIPHNAPRRSNGPYVPNLQSSSRPILLFPRNPEVLLILLLLPSFPCPLAHKLLPQTVKGIYLHAYRSDHRKNAVEHHSDPLA